MRHKNDCFLCPERRKPGELPEMVCGEIVPTKKARWEFWQCATFYQVCNPHKKWVDLTNMKGLIPQGKELKEFLKLTKEEVARLNLYHSDAFKLKKGGEN